MGSVSSLSNIPERDRTGSPVPSYTTTSTRYRRDSSDRGYYRASTPPVRDTGPSRPLDYHSSYSNFEGLDPLDSHSLSDAPSKYSEYSGELEHQLPDIPSVSSHQQLFGSLSSQPTLSSLTPYSQQQNPSQPQLLDKLSMNVEYHTQLSGASGAGITALIPKPNTMLGRPHQLDKSDLKELEMDEIDLIKQRIKLMFYEQQKEKEQEVQQQNAIPQPSDTTSTHQKEGTTDMKPQYDYDLGDQEAFPEQDRALPTAQLRQELESLEQMVTDQKKKFREIKMAREREELQLKQAETKFREQELTNGMFDQHRWQKEQKKRLRELERIRVDQNKRLQQLEYDEHRAKARLRAYETQTNETREQLQRAEVTHTQSTSHKTSGGFNPMDSRMLEVYHNHQSDMLPSKDQARGSVSSGSSHGVHMHTEVDRKAPQYVMQRLRDNQPMRRSEMDLMTTPAERDWVDPTKLLPARVMSMDSVSTWPINEQPDFSREIVNTISESNLTAPTQDDPAPTGWSRYDSRSNRDIPSYLQSNDLYSTTSHSKVTLTEELSQEERLRHLKEECKSSMENVPIKSSEERDHHVAQLQQEAREHYHQYPDPHRQYKLQGGPQNLETNNVPIKTSEERDHHAGQEAREHYHQYPDPHRQYKLQSGPQNPETDSDMVHPPSSEAWNQPLRGTSWNDTRQSAQMYERYQFMGRTDHHYSRNSRSRAYARTQLMSSTAFPADSHPHNTTEHFVQDSTRPPAAPDVVPTSFAPVSSHVLNPQKQVPSERSLSPMSKHSDHTTMPHSPSYTNPHQHVMSPQRERERSHSSSRTSSVTSPNSKQEYEIQQQQQQQPWSPTDRAKVTNTCDQTKYIPSPRHLPAQTPLSPSRPSHDIPPPTKIMYNRSHDLRTSAYERPSMIDHSKPQVTPERDGHLPKPVGTHRYAMTRPENKTVGGHSYSRGRPDPVLQMSFEKSFKNQAPRHPERIQRQQTEL